MLFQATDVRKGVHMSMLHLETLDIRVPISWLRAIALVVRHRDGYPFRKNCIKDSVECLHIAANGPFPRDKQMISKVQSLPRRQQLRCDTASSFEMSVVQGSCRYLVGREKTDSASISASMIAYSQPTRSVQCARTESESADDQTPRL
jgi:hypothetical protein